MARERSRLVQGFYPTQDRIVAAIAKLVRPLTDGNVTVLDAGCGEGTAIRGLKEAWGNPANVKLLGIESDKERADAASKVLDECLWSCIEDSRPSGPVSLLYFNPPYDSVRDGPSLEYALFDQVKEWAAPKTGLLVMIVQKDVLKQKWSDLARKIDEYYDVAVVYDYPEPERSEFGQCVLMGYRRKDDRRCWNDPSWASMVWPTLPVEPEHTRFTLKPGAAVTLHLKSVGDVHIIDAMSRSPLRHSLLREALAPEPPLARPPLPLRAGHVALLLAGGLCDSVIDDPVNGKFMIKGTLNVANRKVKTEEKTDAGGELVAHVDVYRTRYELAVKALRFDGRVESYTSEDSEEAEPAVTVAEEDQC